METEFDVSYGRSVGYTVGDGNREPSTTANADRPEERGKYETAEGQGRTNCLPADVLFLLSGRHGGGRSAATAATSRNVNCSPSLSRCCVSIFSTRPGGRDVFSLAKRLGYVLWSQQVGWTFTIAGSNTMRLRRRQGDALLGGSFRPSNLRAATWPLSPSSILLGGATMAGDLTYGHFFHPFNMARWMTFLSPSRIHSTPARMFAAFN